MLFAVIIFALLWCWMYTQFVWDWCSLIRLKMCRMRSDNKCRLKTSTKSLISHPDINRRHLSYAEMNGYRCTRVLDLNLVKEVRWLFLGHFWPLLKQVVFLGSLDSSKNCPKPKSKYQMKLSMNETLIHTVPRIAIATCYLSSF